MIILKIFISFLTVMITANSFADLKCKATLKSKEASSEKHFTESKQQNGATLLSAEIEDKSFLVSYVKEKHAYVLSISDYKTLHRSETVLANLTANQERAGFQLASEPINLSGEAMPKASILCKME